MSAGAAGAGVSAVRDCLTSVCRSADSRPKSSSGGYREAAGAAAAAAAAVAAAATDIATADTANFSGNGGRSNSSTNNNTSTFSINTTSLSSSSQLSSGALPKPVSSQDQACRLQNDGFEGIPHSASGPRTRQNKVWREKGGRPFYPARRACGHVGTYAGYPEKSGAQGGRAYLKSS